MSCKLQFYFQKNGPQERETTGESAGVKRADKRRMDELRMEVGLKESLKKKLVWSRLKWGGHVERMGDEKLAKEQMPRKQRSKGGEEDRACDGRS